MFSLAYNDVKFIELLSKKLLANKVDYSTIKITSKKVPWIFRRKKLHQKKHVETRWIFRPSKVHGKSTWKRRGFFHHQNYIEKSTWKR